MPTIAMHNKCPSQDSIGDTHNSALCDIDKYSLEVSSTAKSYRIFMGYKAVFMLQTVMMFALIYYSYRPN